LFKKDSSTNVLIPFNPGLASLLLLCIGAICKILESNFCEIWFSVILSEYSQNLFIPFLSTNVKNDGKKESREA
jgi:hypothetical protein